MPSCGCCGKRVNLHFSSKNTSFYDNEYCSPYCREFVEGKHEMVNGWDKTGLKNMSGIEWWPKLKFNCEVCGKEYHTKKNGSLFFCSLECALDLNRKSNIKKAKSLFATFKMMQHQRKYREGDGWMSGKAIYEKMKNRGDVSYNSFPSAFRVWKSYGLIEVRSANIEGVRMNEYRIAERFMSEPIGKFMIECRPKRN
tara:strand:- start:17477 stop:18067 length:591 start_codon:yes stop_codon:yes gene_type:complete